MENRVILEINTLYGTKVENLCQSNTLVEKHVDQLSIIKEKVS